MSEKVWTKEQEEAIKDRDHNLLVSAAAGSGKTTVLIERIIDLVVSGKASVDELLVVTFTEAAAAEMKSKLYKALIDANLTDQIERMPQATICSFHSFALSVVKRYYHIIGIPAGLDVCDGIKEGFLQEEALEDLCTEMFDAKDPDFLHFLDCYEADTGTTNVKAMILSLYRFLMAMPYPWQWASDILNGKDACEKYLEFGGAEVVSLLEIARAYHLKHLETIRNSIGDKFDEKIKQDISYHDSQIAAIKADPEKGLAIFASAPFRVASLSSKDEVVKALINDAKVFRDIAKKVRDKAKSLAEGLSKDNLQKELDAMKPALTIYFKLTKRFYEIYRAKKQDEKCLDFSDMEHFALDILENEDVASEYKDKFKYVFVDEYQDTNSLQETLIGKICRENNLFMVGDVKQSIYKFRLAEPELFLSHYKDYKEGSDSNNKAIDLNSNFRSKSSVIDDVNQIFSKIMTSESCDMVYDEAASLKPGLKYNGELLYPCELDILDINSVKTISGDGLSKVDLSAIQAASIIKNNIGKKIFDCSINAERALDFKDMVVLLPKVKGLGEVYYKAFLDAGIPVYLERDTGYFDTIEIGVFINLLKIIENIKQDIPLLSVLCCPVFQFSENELAEIKLSYPDKSFSEAFVSAAEKNQKVNEFLKQISDYKEASKVLPLADFIYQILLSTGYLDFFASQNAGAQKLVNLRALIDRAEKFEKENMTGLSGFINYAENLAKHKSNVDLGQAKTISESMNCVRIMTIHKSKGLEFPFVLVSGLDTSLKMMQERKTYAFHKSLGASIRLVNPAADSYFDTKIHELIRLKEAKENLAERIRLLYVALTRAQDVLILAGMADVLKLTEKRYLAANDSVNLKTYIDLLIAAMPADSIKILDAENLTGFITETAAASDEFKRMLEDGFNDAESEEISSIINYDYFPDEYASKRKYSVSQIAEESHVKAENGNGENLDFINQAIPEFIEANDHLLSGAEKGTAYHAVMEHIPFDDSPKTIEYITEFINALSEKHILTSSQAECVDPAKIKAFFESDIGKRAISSDKLYKEAPFTLKTEYNGNEVLVQGTIDCYFEEDGEYVLLDYKTNYVDKSDKAASYEHLKENYLPQLKLYKEALEKIGHKKVKEGVLYLFGTSEVLEIN